MRKSSNPTPNYPQSLSRRPVSLATFRDQMADYARAERLRELRAATHESQENVAHEIGVSVKSVRTWESGGKIRWENAKKLATFYGVDPEALVSRDIHDEPVVAPPVGDSQLDRIEGKVDAILDALHGGLAGETIERLVSEALRDLQPPADKPARGGSGSRSGAKQAAPRKAPVRGKRKAG